MSNPKFKCAWICGDGFDTLDEHNEHRRIMHKLRPIAEFVASSLLQEKEQSYKDEREAQREFYLPPNPTAEDISQARAIIAQQKSQLFEKEQRIKELEKDNFELESVVYCLRQRLC